MRDAVTLTSCACLVLAGCPTIGTAEQARSSLHSRYAGQSIDRVVAELGPPSSNFKMTNGGAAYVWELANHTNLTSWKQGGAANTIYCRVRAVTDSSNTVVSIATEDGANVLGESLCAKTLGIRRSA